MAVAEKIDVSGQTVSSWENNRSCVYRVPFNDGEYVFRVTFPSLQDG